MALRRFVAENEQTRYDRLLSLVKRLDLATGSLRNARTEVRTGGSTPRFILTLEPGFKMTGMDSALPCKAVLRLSTWILRWPPAASSALTPPAFVQKIRTPSAAGCGN